MKLFINKINLIFIFCLSALILQAQSNCDNVLDYISGYAAQQNVTGGDGNSNYEITNTNNSGSGSYRDALSQGNRYITFSPALAGQTIFLNSDVIVSGNNITLDGRDAPDLKISKKATKFHGTNYVVAYMNYYNMNGSSDEDCITFRYAPNNGAIRKFFVFKSTFDIATDGAIDIIWNEGVDCYGTISHCKFQNVDKTILHHSGDGTMEGGDYYLSFDSNWFYRTGQRNPFGRDGEVHYYNNLLEGWGGTSNDGGGAYAGRDSKYFMENNIAIAAQSGDPSWSGETIITPKTKAFSPSWNETTSAIKSVGTWLRNDAYVVDQQANQVSAPPYAYSLSTANSTLETYIRQNANADWQPCNEGDCELLSNPNFDNDLASWNYWGCTATSINGIARMTGIFNGPEVWEAAFYTDNILVEQGETYQVKFSARADANRTMDVKVGQNVDPYLDYIYETVNLTTNMQNFTMSFTMNKPTDNNTAFDFFIAGGNTANIYIDNVSLQKANCGTTCQQQGQSCDDGNNCTTGETYDADCNCTGGTFQDADGDGVCAANDPNDNDPCNPNSCNNCDVFDNENFDGGWGIWNDGGSDVRRNSRDAAYANSGSRCVRLRDNSGAASSMYTDALDMSAVTSVDISFSFIANSMENNEDFLACLEFHKTKGS